MKKKTSHDHGCCANTEGVFTTFIGCEVAGVFHSRISNNSNTWLIFKCEWALVVAANGAHWVEGPDSVQRELTRVKKQFQESNRAIRNILELSGVL